MDIRARHGGGSRRFWRNCARRKNLRRGWRMDQYAQSVEQRGSVRSIHRSLVCVAESSAKIARRTDGGSGWNALRDGWVHTLSRCNQPRKSLCPPTLTSQRKQDDRTEGCSDTDPLLEGDPFFEQKPCQQNSRTRIQRA